MVFGDEYNGVTHIPEQISNGKTTTSSWRYDGTYWGPENAIKQYSDERTIASECSWSNYGSVAIQVNKRAYWQGNFGEKKHVEFIDMRGMENMWGRDHSMHIRAYVCNTDNGERCKQCENAKTTPMKEWVTFNCNGKVGQYVRLEYSHCCHNWHFCRALVYGRNFFGDMSSFDGLLSEDKPTFSSYL